MNEDTPNERRDGLEHEHYVNSAI